MVLSTTRSGAFASTQEQVWKVNRQAIQLQSAEEAWVQEQMEGHLQVHGRLRQRRFLDLTSEQEASPPFPQDEEESRKRGRASSEPLAPQRGREREIPFPPAVVPEPEREEDTPYQPFRSVDSELSNQRGSAPYSPHGLVHSGEEWRSQEDSQLVGVGFITKVPAQAQARPSPLQDLFKDISMPKEAESVVPGMAPLAKEELENFWSGECYHRYSP